MTATERLAEIKARAESTTTSGPWEYRETDALPPGLGNVYSAARISPLIGCGHCGENDAVYETGDGEFIAHARTDVPALVAALEAVLALHSRVFDANDTPACRECTDDYPCPTVQTVTGALGGDQ